MAFTGSPVSSTTFTGQISGTTVAKSSPSQLHGPLAMARFTYTHAAGAGTGEVNLVQLLPGNIEIYPDLSRIVSSQMAANADLHLGFRNYEEPDGDSVAEDDNAFADNLDSGGAAIDAAWSLPAIGFASYSVAKSARATSGARLPGGMVIYAMVDTANIEDTDTLDGWAGYRNLG